MSTELATNEQPKPLRTRPTPAIKVMGKVKVAVDAMVWEGLQRAAAAKVAGLKEKSLYAAFRKPHVKAYYLSELDVLRTSERARNIHAAVEVREQTDNQTARMVAVRWLNEDAEAQRSSAAQRVTTPGVTVILNVQRDPAMVDNVVIELNPGGVLNGDTEQPFD